VREYSCICTRSLLRGACLASIISQQLTVFIPSMSGMGCHIPGVPVHVLVPVRSHDVLSVYGYRTDPSQVWLDRQLAPARHNNDPGKRNSGIVHMQLQLP
jgi:hypothetical protein